MCVYKYHIAILCTYVHTKIYTHKPICVCLRLIKTIYVLFVCLLFLLWENADALQTVTKLAWIGEDVQICFYFWSHRKGREIRVRTGGVLHTTAKQVWRSCDGETDKSGIRIPICSSWGRRQPPADIQIKNKMADNMKCDTYSRRQRWTEEKV